MLQTQATGTDVIPPVKFDADLIRRYDGDGPRYTSYPTARQFHAEFETEDYRRAVLHSNNDPIPRALSLYVHVPFCASPCFYCGCTRIITRDPARIAAYLERLHREIGMQGALFDRDRLVRQLHFGGGTPTYLEDGRLEELFRALQRVFAFANEDAREFSIEVDPRTVDPSRLKTLAELGFNRLSFGIQDFDETVQAAVNRVQDPERCLELIANAHSAGFRSVAVDLIYGLPRQTLEGFSRTLALITGAAPDRIAIYGYAHLPEHFKAQRQFQTADLPGPELRLQLLALAVEKLTGAGYEYIGMDHFARPGDDLVKARGEGTLQRNFQGYSTHAGLDLVGLGLSAIGHVGQTFVQNAKTLNGYYGALDVGRLPITGGLVTNVDDTIRADVINRLMCYDEVRFRDIEDAHHIRFRDYFAQELKRLKPMERDGLAQICLDRIQVLPAGRFLLRNLAMVFDAYLPSAASANPLFSKTI
jgi:oxygen-independent coproporphyrinogen-3 oxidase